MKINKLYLVHFRNYSKLNISFGEKMNIFVGDNAQGKTNILEAIVFLALTKSHRIGVNPNIIEFGKLKTKLTGTISKNKVVSKLQIEMTDNSKKLKINHSDIRKVANYISYLNIIIFTPDDLEIIKGAPNIRRNLLNIQLSQISQEYLKSINEYNKILKTRNEYLKIIFSNSIADNTYLDIITDKLIEKAIIIYQSRKRYIDCINLEIDDYFYKIYGEKGLKISYIPNITFDDFEYETIRKKLKHVLKKNYLKELNYGMTIYGPHRDDFIFEFKSNDVKYYGSQGQQRLAIICFKLSEISIFNEYTGTTPVLLLDDIFSELDVRKRNKLLKIIGASDIQSIITTTDLKNINKKFVETACVFKVDNGNVERK